MKNRKYRVMFQLFIKIMPEVHRYKDVFFMICYVSVKKKEKERKTEREREKQNKLQFSISVP